jgi:hypothetical protein
MRERKNKSAKHEDSLGNLLRLQKEASKVYAHECRIRNAFAGDFRTQRPSERVLSRETRYKATALRADLRSVDRSGLIREWEFKIDADHYVLGQILTYVAHARRELNFRPVRGVIAAFTFSEELRMAIEVMNLNIELVLVPPWLRRGGKNPTLGSQPLPIPSIPKSATSTANSNRR